MSFLLMNWKMVAIGLLLALVGILANLYQNERDAFNTFKGGVASAAKAQIAANNRAISDHIINLEVIRKDYENRIPEIRSAAVANYLRRVSKPASGSGGVSASGSGLRVDDAAVQECGLDNAFIEDTAEDAAKIAAWIEYGKLNHIPVKD